MFGSLRAWGERHRVIVDVLWVSPIALFCLLGIASYTSGEGAPSVWGYLVLSTLLIAPLVWRRERPREVFAVVSLVSFGQWLAGLDPATANVSVLIAMYAVAAGCRLRWAVAAGLVAELGLVLVMSHWQTLSPGSFASGSMFVVAVWVTGIYANTRRRYLEELEERADRAERERDQQAKIAAATERARIARELHDVVAHNVSVIIVQADGAGYAMDTDPAQARAAVRTISATGRQALAEMRRLVGVLRQDDTATEEYAPQPGLAQIEELVEQIRGSGLPVGLKITGTAGAVPEGEQLTVYRIVQEALTNTLKHGGPVARASVELVLGPAEITLRVVDDGRGASASRAGQGHGLVGMRERVAMYGGQLDAGPRNGGGFQVSARLPVPRSDVTRAA
ncbi:sensor histidine kinase [Streptosporangium sp. KLBMP 9127]|nr:sensor histidine kinase [Streptosporangium sp. KLBMP 9127]